MLLMTAPQGDLQHAALRQMLVGLRTTLEQEVQVLIAGDGGGDWDAELAIIQTHAETSRLIGATVARVDAGTYGICAACHGHIDDMRLLALPLATECAGCARVSEASTA